MGKGQPLQQERRRAKNDAAFLEARRIFIRLTVQWGQERIIKGQEYPIEPSELKALLLGGGQMVEPRNRPGTGGCDHFVNTVQFGAAIFTVATDEPIDLSS